MQLKHILQILQRTNGTLLMHYLAKNNNKKNTARSIKPSDLKLAAVACRRGYDYNDFMEFSTV